MVFIDNGKFKRESKGTTSKAQAKLEKYTETRKRNEQKYPINEKLNCKCILRKQS